MIKQKKKKKLNILKKWIIQVFFFLCPAKSFNQNLKNKQIKSKSDKQITERRQQQKEDFQSILYFHFSKIPKQK
jgi:hypothetical protein